ncbi:hypothetical protein OVN18_07425 [Microcella daejeonensis]|uniref:Uncharacterized protein n=1 Tax=Microcella daejeonensis TaxID=2994971 RepID=A0A9E8SA84_9MICO|nr:hypothetical protein [Microcella daejeonensis]WAB80407.1 hypothetical protein OVN18_07425 [Microcella daejeonensis]
MSSESAWFRAGEDDITASAARELAHSGSLEVLSVLAQNGAVPRDVIRLIHDHHPELAITACLNSNAPIDLKASVPFRSHSHLALTTLLDELQCTDTQWARFWEEGALAPESPTGAVLDAAGIRWQSG